MAMLQWPLPHLMFVFYRVLVAAFAVTITFISIQLHPGDLLPWPVFLTHWSFLLLTCHLLCAAVIVLLSTCCERRESTRPYRSLSSSGLTPIPCYMRFSWFLFSVTSPAAILVSVVYFTSLFPRLHRGYLNFEDASLHVMNSVLVILELSISAFPVRLLHAVYVLCYALAYVVFSVVYWAFDHSHVMYPGVLDWNAPTTTAVVLVILAAVGMPLLQFILFGIYHLRMYIYTHSACLQSRD